MVVIVDYGMGNLRSISHKLNRLRIECMISSRHEDIDKATHLILPGVGHFATGMKNLRRADLLSVLNRKVIEDKTPVMGICLGMQLFTSHSEEGDAAGLGWIDGRTLHFHSDGQADQLRVPHIGWNLLQQRRQCPYLADVAENQRFYFVHSYYVACNCPEDVAATTHYGRDFVSVVQRGNIFGTQFHPEKSHRRGIDLIRRFVQESPDDLPQRTQRSQRGDMKELRGADAE